mmetsp:Transcript_7295/g.14978  ORF Transcript_7295/g.14978 Transcript_7295/m.14978 type:complete len:263 (-) Transcript_7295:264-1052(-)
MGGDVVVGPGHSLAAAPATGGLSGQVGAPGILQAALQEQPRHCAGSDQAVAPTPPARSRGTTPQRFPVRIFGGGRGHGAGSLALVQQPVDAVQQPFDAFEQSIDAIEQQFSFVQQPDDYLEFAAAARARESLQTKEAAAAIIPEIVPAKVHVAPAKKLEQEEHQDGEDAIGKDSPSDPAGTLLFSRLETEGSSGNDPTGAARQGEAKAQQGRPERSHLGEPVADAQKSRQATTEAGLERGVGQGRRRIWCRSGPRSERVVGH